MFHIRRSCIFTTTIFILICLVMLHKYNNLHVGILQVPSVNTKGNYPPLEVEVTGSQSEKSRLELYTDFSPLRKNLSSAKTLTEKPRDNIDQMRHNRPVSLDTKLLEDNELREGEISYIDKEAPDVVIKYENGMFGLIDNDPTLHVWRTSFATFGEIWPQPLSITTGYHLFTICSSGDDLSFIISGADNYIIQSATKRYKDLLCKKMVSFYPSQWRHQQHYLDTVRVGNHILRRNRHNRRRETDLGYGDACLKGTIKTVSIFVESDGHQWPSLYMNESYRISVGVTGIFIVAQETWGVLRALESISQLAWRTQSGRVFINETKITDEPRFKHRGVMLDTARHFITKNIILKNLDAMEMNKLNVFHWHITDDQSFPLVTDNHPEFAKFGSYDFESKVYRPDDVREIVEYARLRGIRVIPEIDSPSHSLSWRKSHPEVLTRCVDLNNRWSGHYGPLNMASAATYRLLRSLFTDVVRLFPDQWVHLGSDEIATSCLLGNPALQRWMQARAIFSVDLLADFYMRKLQNIITQIGGRDTSLQRGFIVWQEAYERNSALKKGTIVQLWKSQSTSEAVSLARQQINVVYSACWYLDRLEYGAQWVAHYQCDPGDEIGSMLAINEYGSSSQSDYWRKYILGGEAAMWTEFFDSDNVLPRIWPLAGAAAERLWSPSSVNNAEKAAPRLEEMRCRMMIRSVPVGVAGGAGDCSQSTEGTISLTLSQEVKIDIQDKVVFSLSPATFLLQLFAKMFNNTSFLVIFIVAVAICIYLHRKMRLSIRLLSLIVMVILCLYLLTSVLVLSIKVYLPN